MYKSSFFYTRFYYFILIGLNGNIARLQIQYFVLPQLHAEEQQ